jgi:hypothetical protein
VTAPASRVRSDSTAVLRDGSVELRVRAAVALRTRPIAGGVAYYLSLHDAEINARAEAFWVGWAGMDTPHAWSNLELTDAIVCIVGERVCVARGGAASFPLVWSRCMPGLVLSTVLPVDSGEPFTRDGLVAAAAGACVHASYEPNGFTMTPLARWRRVRRGSAVHFVSGRFVDERVIDPCGARAPMSREAITRDLRAALDTYAHSQRGTARSLVEISGGFDSTLAAAPASDGKRVGMHGISVHYQFYEFRFERALQQATAEAFGIARAELDGPSVYPYTPAASAVRFDAPSVFVTGIRHAELVGHHAASLSAQRLYMGHGGDQTFATDLLAREVLVANSPTHHPFTAGAWRTVRQALDDMQASEWRDRRLGTFVYDAAQDVWVKETFGATVRTPFTDLALFRAALAWSAWCSAHGAIPDKSILAEAAPDLIPVAVRQRRGKVAYDGVWMRGYRAHADHIATVFEGVRDVLGHIGVDVDWLQRRARDLGAWHEKSDREVLAVYAIAYWLEAWGIRRVSDVAWSA